VTGLIFRQRIFSIGKGGPGVDSGELWSVEPIFEYDFLEREARDGGWIVIERVCADV